MNLSANLPISAKMDNEKTGNEKTVTRTMLVFATPEDEYAYCRNGNRGKFDEPCGCGCSWGKFVFKGEQKTSFEFGKEIGQGNTFSSAHMAKMTPVGKMLPTTPPANVED